MRSPALFEPVKMKFVFASKSAFAVLTAHENDNCIFHFRLTTLKGRVKFFYSGYRLTTLEGRLLTNLDCLGFFTVATY
jgi:hypothetical protein